MMGICVWRGWNTDWRMFLSTSLKIIRYRGSWRFSMHKFIKWKSYSSIVPYVPVLYGRGILLNCRMHGNPLKSTTSTYSCTRESNLESNVESGGTIPWYSNFWRMEDDASKWCVQTSSHPILGIPAAAVGSRQRSSRMACIPAQNTNSKVPKWNLVSSGSQRLAAGLISSSTWYS